MLSLVDRFLGTSIDSVESAFSAVSPVSIGGVLSRESICAIKGVM